MNIKKLILFFIILIFANSCAKYKPNSKEEKKYYQSSGFALIYNDNFFNDKIINIKINNEQIIAAHSFLKKNTSIRIVNPKNQKSVETRIYKRSKYPSIFNIVISKKISKILDLDANNPYVEFFEIKKNKTFIAKKSDIFDEEINVADKAPVDEIKVDVLNENNEQLDKSKNTSNNFILVISDFYYKDSAQDLLQELTKKISIKKIYVKKINNKKYRLYAGPFENFNALKSTYISLNKLGFDNLNIYIE